MQNIPGFIHFLGSYVYCGYKKQWKLVETLRLDKVFTKSIQGQYNTTDPKSNNSRMFFICSLLIFLGKEV